MPATPDGRRLRSAASREAILDAAEREFEERGYSATSIRRVALAADMSPPGVARHFATKQALFTALLHRVQERNLAVLLGEGLASHPPADRIVIMARDLTSRRRETELYTVLLGEARQAGHPAHDFIAGEMRSVHVRMGEQFGADAGAALHAAWDGLRLLGLYLPDRVDAAGALEHRLRTAGPGGQVAAVPRPALTMTTDDGPADESIEGRVLRAAMAAFAEVGYRDARVRDIATAAGAPHSTLLYHYATKEILLRAVLDSDGPASTSQIPDGVERDGGEFLRQVYEIASASPRDSDINRVRSAIAFEAVERKHAAHRYFVMRYGALLDRLVGVFEGLSAEGRLAPGIDAATEAVWTLALWEGLRVQSFYLDEHRAPERIRAELNRALAPGDRLA